MSIWPILKKDMSPITESTQTAWLLPEQMPPWRRPDENAKAESFNAPPMNPKSMQRGQTYLVPPLLSKDGGDDPIQRTYDALNIALMLRRPILVSGDPGIGKSSLAYFLAHMLDLGAPLVWPINSKTSLTSGLYNYDAIGHLGSTKTNEQADDTTNIEQYITLGPVGTALYPWQKPRVLLIDELDKASFDLPNDLLYILEDGHFTIPELKRAGMEKAKILGSDVVSLQNESNEASEETKLTICNGQVRMYHPPIMVITSNNERQFSDAFKRRCVQLHLGHHKDEELRKLIQNHFGDDFNETIFEEIKGSNDPADVLLQEYYTKLVAPQIDNPRSIIKR